MPAVIRCSTDMPSCADWPEFSLPLPAWLAIDTACTVYGQTQVSVKVSSSCTSHCCPAGAQETAQATLGSKRGLLGSSPAQGSQGALQSGSSGGIPGFWPLSLPPFFGCGICGCLTGGGRLAELPVHLGCIPCIPHQHASVLSSTPCSAILHSTCTTTQLQQ